MINEMFIQCIKFTSFLYYNRSKFCTKEILLYKIFIMIVITKKFSHLSYMILLLMLL